MKNPVRTTLLLVVGSMVVAALCLGTPSTARAAGLGELRLLSELGQPLNAEIDIVSARAEDKAFSARLAPSIYQAGVDVDPALSGIRFKVVRHGARSVLRLSTRQAVNAPYLELPVELRSNTTRVTRQYTVLLNPPFFKDRQRIATRSREAAFTLARREGSHRLKEAHASLRVVRPNAGSAEASATSSRIRAAPPATPQRASRPLYHAEHQQDDHYHEQQP